MMSGGIVLALFAPIGLSGDMMLQIFLIVGIVLAVFAFICWAVYLGRLANKKRIEDFKQEAEAMGLTFTQLPLFSFADHYSHFKLFSRGRQRQFSNLIEGDSGDVTLQIFDYQFTTGSGTQTRKHAQTVTLLKSSQLNIPSLTIDPASIVSLIGSSMGFQDINFDSHPTFSKWFVLKGDNEEAIRNDLTPATLEYFERQFLEHRRLTSLEASGDTLFFYYASAGRSAGRSGEKKCLIEAEEIKELLARAYELFGILTAQT